uniref:Uncharacterized protein n=1 Tax=Rhizophora mucronata TaxID=61149 RepID=A0A2P2J3R8_RHIMU
MSPNNKTTFKGKHGLQAPMKNHQVCKSYVASDQRYLTESNRV